MLQILTMLAGLVCLFKNEINVNKEKSVRGAPIKILGLILIVAAGSVTFIQTRGLEWVPYVAFGILFVYLISIIIFCAKPIQGKKQ